MASTLKNSVKGGSVAGIGIVVVALVALFVLGPLIVAVGWHMGLWSFELAVIVLLLFAIYASGGGGE